MEAKLLRAATQRQSNAFGSDGGGSSQLATAPVQIGSLQASIAALKAAHAATDAALMQFLQS